MSKALKCDFCQTFFDPINNYLGKYIHIDGYYLMGQNNYYENERGLDLCPKCAKIFLQLLNGEELIEKKLFYALQEDFDNSLSQLAEAQQIIDELNKETKDEKKRKYYDDFSCSLGNFIFDTSRSDDGGGR